MIMGIHMFIACLHLRITERMLNDIASFKETRLPDATNKFPAFNKKAKQPNLLRFGPR